MPVSLVVHWIYLKSSAGNKRTVFSPSRQFKALPFSCPTFFCHIVYVYCAMTKTGLLIPLLCCCAIVCLGAPASPPIVLAEKDISFRNEVQRAIDRGLIWLQQHQQTNGCWSTADQPAVTALALTACKGDPNDRFTRTEPEWVKKGYSFILGCVRPDGGIHQTN